MKSYKILIFTLFLINPDAHSASNYLGKCQTKDGKTVKISKIKRKIYVEKKSGGKHFIDGPIDLRVVVDDPAQYRNPSANFKIKDRARRSGELKFLQYKGEYDVDTFSGKNLTLNLTEKSGTVVLHVDTKSYGVIPAGEIALPLFTRNAYKTFHFSGCHFSDALYTYDN